MDTPLELSVERNDGTTVVTAVGEIEMSTAPMLRECLLATAGNVVVDLRAVSFLDSTGIGVLVAANKRLRATDRELTLRKPQGIVLTALRTVGLVDWIED